MISDTDTEEETKVFDKFGFRPEFRHFNRDSITYLYWLFPDDLDPELKDIFNTEGFTGAIKYFSPYQPIESFTSDSAHPRPIFGGKREFFRPGSHILDIGSGGGQAIHELTTKYANRDIRFYGIDIRYGEQSPKNKALPQNTYVCAKWNHLPFKDHSFDRLMSVESFPLYFFSGKDRLWNDVEDTFKEITRIAKNGTIWRGTLPVPTTKREAEIFVREMIRQVSKEDVAKIPDFFTKNGWEVYFLPNDTFVAKLTKS